MIMRTFSSQPTICYPEALEQRGFADHSYRHDLLARAHNEARKLMIWCAEEVPAKREFEDGPRFAVYRADDEGYELGCALFETESLNELINFLDNLPPVTSHLSNNHTVKRIS